MNMHEMIAKAIDKRIDELGGAKAINEAINRGESVEILPGVTLVPKSEEVLKREYNEAMNALMNGEYYEDEED